MSLGSRAAVGLRSLVGSRGSVAAGTPLEDPHKRSEETGRDFPAVVDDDELLATVVTAAGAFDDDVCIVSLGTGS